MWKFQVRFSPFLIALTILIQSPRDADAASPDWADFKGRLVYNGSVPPPRTLGEIREPEAHAGPLFDESLLVNPTNRGLADVIIYRVDVSLEAQRIHPDLESETPPQVELRMRNGRFVPRMTLLRTDQPLAQFNEDATTHVPNIQLLKNPPPGYLIPKGDPVVIRYRHEEHLPCPIRCSVQRGMRGYVLIRKDPYMAVTDQHGRFRVLKLPPGEHTFRFWHDRAGYLNHTAIGPYRTDKRGRLRITISEEGVDVGDVELNAEQLDHLP